MRLVLIGASGHGKVCAEIAELNGYEEILFLDDDIGRKECGGHAVVGVKADFKKFIDGSTEFFVSIGNAGDRKKIQDEIVGSNGNIATLLHSKSVIGKDVKIGNGSVVIAGAVINSGTVIGDGVIINTSSSVDHDCVVGAFSHIAVGAHLCGGVEIGEMSWIGAGAIVINNLTICGDCMIGAGAVVIRDIEEEGTYLGVPAQKCQRGHR